MNKLFGTKHLILLAISLILIVVLYLLSRKMKFKTLCKTLFIIGIVSEIIKVFYYTIANEAELGGVLPKGDLPFHLCSIQIIFIAIINFSSNEKLKRTILSFMLPSCLFGGLAAIAIATTTSLNAWVITFQYFLYHIAIIVFALNLFTSKEFKIEIKDYFRCLSFLLLIMFFAFYINSIVYDGTDNINFMYVVSPPVEGLPFLNENHGWIVYIAHYASLILLCVTLCYIKPIICAIKSKIQSKKVQKTAQNNE